MKRPHAGMHHEKSAYLSQLSHQKQQFYPQHICPAYATTESLQDTQSPAHSYGAQTVDLFGPKRRNRNACCRYPASCHRTDRSTVASILRGLRHMRLKSKLYGLSLDHDILHTCRFVNIYKLCQMNPAGQYTVGPFKRPYATTYNYCCPDFAAIHPEHSTSTVN